MIVQQSSAFSPLVSVIIPCYRQATYLPQAIQSVLDQTWSAVEILVVNDGSDDDTDQVVEPYLARVRYFKQANRGVSSARNLGIQHASGGFLLFLDADDVLENRSVEMLVSAVSGTDGLAMGSYKMFTKSPHEEREKVWLPPEISEFLPWILQGSFPLHCHLVAAKDVKEVNGFDESLHGHEDYYLWWKLAKRGVRIVSVPEAVSYYRRTAGSLTTNLSLQLETKALVVARMAEDVYNLAGLQRWAPEMLRLLYGVRRIFLARKQRGVHFHKLTQWITMFRQKGWHVKAPWPLWFQDILPWTLGAAMERSALKFCELFIPTFFQRIRDLR